MAPAVSQPPAAQHAQTDAKTQKPAPYVVAGEDAGFEVGGRYPP